MKRLAKLCQKCGHRHHDLGGQDIPGTHLHVIGLARLSNDNPSRHRVWYCRCACGRVVSIDQSNLLRGAQKGCGRCGLQGGGPCKRKLETPEPAPTDLLDACVYR